MNPNDLSAWHDFITRISRLRAAVVGDFAVDCYYDLRKDTGDVSLETGKIVYQGSKPSTTLGAAGNVLRNLAALGVKNLHAFGVAGDDLWGRELRFLLSQTGATTDGIIPWQGDSCTYVKPMESGIEEHRIDFGSTSGPGDDTWQIVLSTLQSHPEPFDLILVNQQFPHPLLTPERLQQISRKFSRTGGPVVVANPRSGGGSVRGIYLQLNEGELGLLMEASEGVSKPSLSSQARILAGQIEGQVLVTRGAEGMLLASPEETWSAAAVPVHGPIDIVGAGDTVMAAFGSALAAGAAPEMALRFANAAASLSIRHIGATGTASPEEIFPLFSGADGAA